MKERKEALVLDHSKPGHMQDGSTWAVKAERPDLPGYTPMNMVLITKIDGVFEAWEELALKPCDMEVIAKADTLSDIYDAVEDLINNGRPTPLRRAQMELEEELKERDAAEEARVDKIVEDLKNEHSPNADSTG